MRWISQLMCCLCLAYSLISSRDRMWLMVGPLLNLYLYPLVVRNWFRGSIHILNSSTDSPSRGYILHLVMTCATVLELASLVFHNPTEFPMNVFSALLATSSIHVRSIELKTSSSQSMWCSGWSAGLKVLVCSSIHR